MVVFIGGLLAGGGWNGDNANNDKIAVMSGLLEASPPLPEEVPPPGSVAWSDGSSTQVDLISASAAFDRAVAELRDAPSSGKCERLLAREDSAGAELTTQDRPTSRGTAGVPVWQLEFQPSDSPIAPITVPAVKDAISLATDSSSLPNDDNAGVYIDTAYGDAGSSTLTVAFTGSPLHGDKPCGSDYSAQAVESERAVAVIVSESRELDACGMFGCRRIADG